MGYRNLQHCVDDLARHGHLVRFDEEVDPHLEAAEIHRRVFASGGPAVLYSRVKGCRFPLVSNLFGDIERARFIFRDTLSAVSSLIRLKTDPGLLLQAPWRHWRAPIAALHMLPRRRRSGPVVGQRIAIDELPQIQSWPDDGGAFVTLPLVYSEHVDSPGLMNANLGMYRVQLSGNRYDPNKEVGLHYQIHRGIGVHQTAAVRRGESLRVNIFVGGAPAMSLAAVMPLPEGMSELTFAGAMAGHRIPMITRNQPLAVYAEADFCISGTIDPDRLLPEGPFGDHLGYYSLVHDFPVLKVDQVYARQDAIWPFTVVGRPPQEDTAFGQLIHELTGPVIPHVIPGLHAVHAVDAAGVHPLMLAIGSERYTPYQSAGRPAELLTQANAILGHGQMSLAKYLLIVNKDDDPELRITDVESFLDHLLRRVDWSRDLHFQTCTTMDTLDYSGGRINEGSKLVVAAGGPPRFPLKSEIDGRLRLADGFSDPRICFPGVMAVSGPAWAPDGDGNDDAARTFCSEYEPRDAACGIRLIVIVDDSDFVSRNLNNFLWVVFTRTNPAADVFGVESFIRHKHWGCRGPLVLDARSKPHHAPPLVADGETCRRVDALAARGGPLAQYL